MRKDTSSALFVFSATAIALLLASPLVLPNHLFQPVQAQSNVDVSFATASPASGANDNCLDAPAEVTFDANGTASTSSGDLTITSGTFNVNASDYPNGQPSYGGDITAGKFNTTGDGDLSLQGTVGHTSDLPFCNSIQGSTYYINTQCSASNTATVTIGTGISYPNELDFQGVVECSSSSQGGAVGDTTTQSMTAGSSRDGDRDGIPDPTDRCTHNSNPKCFKEGDTSNATTTTTTLDQQQQQSSSSNRTGNQTR